MDRAVRRDLVAANPARGEGSRLKVKRPRRVWLELDEVDSLLKAAGDYRPELSTLILSGLRIGELGGLRWRAVDLARGTLTVEQSKTGEGEGRRIDVSPMLLEELKLHRAANPDAGPDDLVFPTSNGLPRTKDNSRGRLRTILKRANKTRATKGQPPIAHVTNHVMRRTFASLLYEAGETPPYVMDQMGHKSAAMALEVYARKMKRSRDTGERMDALVRGADWARAGTNGENGNRAFAVTATK
jgi:integrase